MSRLFSFQVTFVSVKQLLRVKLIEGLFGSWFPCLPQYFTIAMFDGLRFIIWLLFILL